MVFDTLSHMSFDNDHKFLYFSQLGIPFETYNKNFHEFMKKKSPEELNSSSKSNNNTNATIQEIFHDSDNSSGMSKKAFPLKKIKKYFSYAGESDDQVDRIIRQEIAKEMRRLMPSSARTTDEHNSPHKSGGNSPSQHNPTAANPHSYDKDPFAAANSLSSSRQSKEKTSSPQMKPKIAYQKKKFDLNPFSSPQKTKTTRSESAMSTIHSTPNKNKSSVSSKSKVTSIDDLDTSLASRNKGKRKGKIDRPWNEPHKPWKGKEKVDKEEVKTVIMEQFEEMNQITAQLRLLEKKRP